MTVKPQEIAAPEVCSVGFPRLLPIRLAVGRNALVDRNSDAVSAPHYKNFPDVRYQRNARGGKSFQLIDIRNISIGSGTVIPDIIVVSVTEIGGGHIIGPIAFSGAGIDIRHAGTVEILAEES